MSGVSNDHSGVNAFIEKPYYGVLAHLAHIVRGVRGKLVIMGIKENLDQPATPFKDIRHINNDENLVANAIAAVRAIEQRGGFNIYFHPGLMRPDLPEGSKGKKNDVAALAMLWVEFDGGGWTEASVEARLPVEGVYIQHMTQTSAGNYQVFWGLDRPYKRDEAEPVLAALVDTTGGDPAVKNVDRIMRVPGTTNYPDKKKRDRYLVEHGIVRVPEMGKALVVADIWEFTALEDFKSALLKKYPSAFDTHASPSTDFDWNLPVVAGAHRSFTAGGAAAFLDDEKWTDRSEGAFAFIAECKERNYTPQQTLAEMLDHSNTAVMAHYNGDEVRVRDDVQRTWAKIEVKLDWLEEMNSKFAVAVNGTQCRIALLDRGKIEFMKLDDFHNMHANRLIEMGDKKQPISKVWFKHEGRHEYLSPGVVFEPGAADRPGALNLWRGWGVKPITGKWPLFRAHLLNVVCQNNQSHYDYLIRYFALGVQQPSRPIGVALAFRGRQGAGKGIVARTYGQLFGLHFRHYNRSEQLLGRFNGNLGAACVVFLDEALFAGNPQHEAILKALITEPTIEIEEKFLMPVTAKNHLRVIIASNNDWIAPVAIEDRRFAVFDVADTHTPASEHAQYWKELHDEIENGGKAAFLHDLLDMDLSGFDVREIPNTDARTAQKRHSLSGPMRWLHDVLDSGAIGLNRWGANGLEMVGDTAYEHYCEASTKLHRDYRPAAKHVWAKAVYDALGDRIRRYRPQVGEERPRMWTLGPLGECRVVFAKNLKLTGMVWDDE